MVKAKFPLWRWIVVFSVGRSWRIWALGLVALLLLLRGIAGTLPDGLLGLAFLVQIVVVISYLPGKLPTHLDELMQMMLWGVVVLLLLLLTNTVPSMPVFSVDFTRIVSVLLAIGQMVVVNYYRQGNEPQAMAQ